MDETEAGSPLRWTTKAEVAYAAVRSRVIEGSLPPGSTIDQRTLAASIGVSTTPLREAVRRLESEGFIRQTAHHEMRVSELSLNELEDIYDVRIKLLPAAAALAAERATETDRETVARLAEFPANAAAPTILAHHARFHRSLYSGCGNKILIDILDSLADRSNRYRRQLIEDFQASGVRLRVHRKLAKAYVEGRSEELAELIEADLRKTLRQLATLLGKSR